MKLQRCARVGIDSRPSFHPVCRVPHGAGSKTSRGATVPSASRIAYQSIGVPTNEKKIQRASTRINSSSIDRTPEKWQPKNPSDDIWDRLEVVSGAFTKQFALWVVAFSLTGFFFPWTLTWFNKDCVTGALAVTMICMGCTLTVDDFKAVAQQPGKLFAGVMLQYTIMPLLGFGISRFLGLPTAVAAGMVLVSCCPGGVASNMVCFIAKADVALSVAMTSVSTMLAVVLTPLLTKFLLGTSVPISGWGLFMSTVQVVLIPVVIGVALRSMFPGMVTKISKVAPLMGVILTSMIDGAIVAQNAAGIVSSGVAALLGCSVLHLGGFGLGYGLSKSLGFEEQVARTTSIEVGMQNSGLGSVLAMQHFPSPVTASTCVISACYHSIVGSVLAGWWHGKQEDSLEEC
ncbi:hypothetical protein BSKO_03922 [Bryopsis sp. KO-2023]|nr:hypothetical protein BSKO_03922 [Bryopsis sp. KO-2023]